MTHDRAFVVELAEVTYSMWKHDNFCDPAAEEIAQRHFGNRSFPRSIIKEVESVLPNILYKLKSKYKVKYCCLLTSVYYKKVSDRPGHEGSQVSFRDVKPTDRILARKCIPFSGNNGKSAGLYFPSTMEDPIWVEFRQLTDRSSSGKLKKGYDLMSSGLLDAMLSPEGVRSFLERTSETLGKDVIASLYRIVESRKK